MEEIYEFISKSNITTLGYSYSYERKKDDFLSNIPHYKIENYNPYEKLTSYIRDQKINSILNETNDPSKHKTIVLDLGNLFIKGGDRKFIVVRRMVEYLRNFSIENGINIIITVPTYTRITDDSIGVDSSLMYAADFVLTISGKLKVLKNRYSLDNIEIEL
jgi:hypothetical protein